MSGGLSLNDQNPRVGSRMKFFRAVKVCGRGNSIRNTIYDLNYKYITCIIK